MATLHMDIEACRSVQSSMKSQHDQMTQALSTVTSSVNQTVGSSWIGNSASEFQQQYESLRSAITSQLDQLDQLSTAFANEITQWETVSSKLG